MNIVRSFFRECIRRGVLRSLGAYVAIVWLLAQGLVDLFPAVGLPEWSIRVFLAAAVAATPFIAVIAWRYDLTRKGFLRDRVDVATSRREAIERRLSDPTRASKADSGTATNFIVATWTDDRGKEHSRQFFDAFLVGRDFKADIRLSSDCVSRRHLEVYPKGGDWFIRDLGSLNGTYIDGASIEHHRIDADIDVRLDRSGPVIRLESLPAQATAVGTSSQRS